MPISQTKDIITLEYKGASAEIYFYGAHVSSWKSRGEKTGGEVKERLFMSKKAVLDGSGPIRGGIPIAFPIFATDVHPDYPELGGAHGFARINRWTLAEQKNEEGGVEVKMVLESNEGIKKMFPHAFKLELLVTLKEFTLDVGLKVVNLGKESFRFNTCLHTYYLTPSAPSSLFTSLSSLTYTDRLNPSSPTNLTPSSDSASLAVETAQCYHLPSITSKPYTSHLAYDMTKSVAGQKGEAGGEGLEIVLSGGWKDAVLWNPGQTTGDKIPDMGEGDWERFVCWEPGNIQELETLEGGGAWEGKQEVRAL